MPQSAVAALIDLQLCAVLVGGNRGGRLSLAAGVKG